MPSDTPAAQKTVLLPLDPEHDGQHVVSDGQGTFLWTWRSSSRTWEGENAADGVEVATPEGAAMMGFKLARAA